jgi:hypothetical protein
LFAAVNSHSIVKFTGPISITPSVPNTGEKIIIKTELQMEYEEDNIIVFGGIDSESLFRKVYKHTANTLKDQVQFTWTANAGSHRAWFRLSRQSEADNLSKNIDLTESLFIVPGGLNSIPWTDVSSSTALKSLNSDYHLTGDSFEKLPDLVLSDPADRYLIAYMEEKISVPITVKNSGSLNTPASSLIVKCNERGVESIQTLPVSPLSAGETIVLKAEYIPKSQWDVLCDISIDPEMRITESDENNNSNRFTLQIWTKSLPDLIPSIKYSILRLNEMRWRVTIRNIGETESEPIEYSISFLCKGGTSELQPPAATPILPVTPQIAPGQTFIFNGSHSLDGDICVFLVKIDPFEKLKEKDENNNTAVVTIRLK